MAAMDPNFMKDALEMMQDPAVMRQASLTPETSLTLFTEL